MYLQKSVFWNLFVLGVFLSFPQRKIQQKELRNKFLLPLTLQGKLHSILLISVNQNDIFEQQLVLVIYIPLNWVLFSLAMQKDLWWTEVRFFEPVTVHSYHKSTFSGNAEAQPRPNRKVIQLLSLESRFGLFDLQPVWKLYHF